MFRNRASTQTSSRQAASWNDSTTNAGPEEGPGVMPPVSVVCPRQPDNSDVRITPAITRNIDRVMSGP